MTPLEQARATLDGFAPDCFQDFHLPAFSRETVESLLQAHELRIRKQVLLEAEEHFNGMGAWSEHHLQNELRRMADDLEGGKK